jgi:hypothetical protein
VSTLAQITRDFVTGLDYEVDDFEARVWEALHEPPRLPPDYRYFEMWAAEARMGKLQREARVTTAQLVLGFCAVVVPIVMLMTSLVR